MSLQPEDCKIADADGEVFYSGDRGKRAYIKQYSAEQNAQLSDKQRGEPPLIIENLHQKVRETISVPSQTRLLSMAPDGTTLFISYARDETVSANRNLCILDSNTKIMNCIFEQEFAGRLLGRDWIYSPKHDIDNVWFLENTGNIALDVEIESTRHDLYLLDAATHQLTPAFSLTVEPGIPPSREIESPTISRNAKYLFLVIVSRDPSHRTPFTLVVHSLQTSENRTFTPCAECEAAEITAVRETGSGYDVLMKTWTTNLVWNNQTFRVPQ